MFDLASGFLLTDGATGHNPWQSVTYDFGSLWKWGNTVANVRTVRGRQTINPVRATLLDLNPIAWTFLTGHKTSYRYLMNPWA